MSASVVLREHIPELTTHTQDHRGSAGAAFDVCVSDLCVNLSLWVYQSDSCQTPLVSS